VKLVNVAGGQPDDRLPGKVEGGVDLVDAHLHPGLRITSVPDCDAGWGQLAVAVIGSGHPAVVGDAAAPTNRSQRAVGARQLLGQWPNSADPIEERGGVQQRADITLDGVLQPVKLRGDPVTRQPGQCRHATGNHHATAEPAAAQGADQPQGVFLVEAEPGGRDREGGGVGQLGQHVQVVGDVLEFGVQHADQRCGERYVSAGEGFHGVGERQRVRHRRDALNAFGQQHTVVDGQALEPLLHSAVLVVRPIRR